MSDTGRPGANLPRAVGHAPPLGLWIAVGILCLLCVAGGAAIMQGARLLWFQNLDARVAAEYSQVESLPAPGVRKGPLVMLLGTSLTQMAIGKAIHVQDRLGAKSTVLFFYRGSAPSVWIQKILPVAERAHPDLLLVEYDLVDPISDDQVLGFMDSLYFTVSILRHGIAYAPPDTVERDCMARKRSLQEALVKYDSLAIPKQPSPSELENLARLRRAGIDVVVLNLPRAGELERAAPDLSRWRNQLVALSKANGFAVWTLPGEWRQGDFCDFAHLNKKGQAKFLPWLVAKIRSELRLSP